MARSRPNVQISADPGKRPNRQQVAAAATRREILMAARRLFAERGYVRTSVAEIADEAGASLPTIYANVGAKKTIVMALRDLIGEEARADEAVAKVAEEHDPARLVGLAAG